MDINETSVSCALWRMPKVTEVTGLSKPEVYKLEREGKFPRRVKPTPRTTAWVAREVIAWVNDRIDESRNGKVQLGSSEWLRKPRLAKGCGHDNPKDVAKCEEHKLTSTTPTKAVDQ